MVVPVAGLSAVPAARTPRLLRADAHAEYLRKQPSDPLHVHREEALHLCLRRKQPSEGMGGALHTLRLGLSELWALYAV